LLTPEILRDNVDEIIYYNMYMTLYKEVLLIDKKDKTISEKQAEKIKKYEDLIKEIYNIEDRYTDE